MICIESKRIGNNSIRKTYEALFEAYAPQHWWPGESPLEIIVGAILTQNTAWTNVEKALANLKDRGVLSVEGLQETQEAELARLIRPAGYFNIKARKLKAFINHLFEKHGGALNHLLDQEVDELREELLGIWGIGEETADSIALYAAGKPSFVIDTYTKRLFSRLGFCAENVKYADLRALFMEGLPRDAQLYNEYHALIVHHGKYVCRKTKPRCQNCTLSAVCTTGNRPLVRTV